MANLWTGGGVATIASLARYINVYKRPTLMSYLRRRKKKKEREDCKEEQKS